MQHNESLTARWVKVKPQKTASYISQNASKYHLLLYYPMTVKLCSQLSFNYVRSIRDNASKQINNI